MIHKFKCILALTLALTFSTANFACASRNNTATLPPPSQDAQSPSNDNENLGENDNLDNTLDATPPPSDESSGGPSAGSGSGGTGSGGTGSGGSGSGSAGSGGVENTPVVKPTITSAKYIRCTGDSVNLRAGAGTNYSVLGVAEKGTSYAVLGQSGNWYKTYYRGKTAYLYASYAAVFSIAESKNAQIERVIDEGYKLIGVPYVYGAVRLHDGKGNLLGGFTAQKFDCSSLMQYIFYQGAGKLLQVTTRTQVKQGQYVAKNDLQRGDCIFFTNETRYHLSGVERVGHVALYLGDNYILHTASDYARIEKISATRWSYYIEARRFL